MTHRSKRPRINERTPGMSKESGVRPEAARKRFINVFTEVSDGAA